MKKYYLEHQTLGRWFVCPIVQVTQRIILEIDGFQIEDLDYEEEVNRRWAIAVLLFLLHPDSNNIAVWGILEAMAAVK